MMNAVGLERTSEHLSTSLTFPLQCLHVEMLACWFTVNESKNMKAASVNILYAPLADGCCSNYLCGIFMEFSGTFIEAAYNKKNTSFYPSTE